MTFCLTQDPPESTRQATFSLHAVATIPAWISACKEPRRPLTLLLLRLLDIHLSTLQKLLIALRKRLDTSEVTPRSQPQEATGESTSFDPLGDAVLTYGLDRASYIDDDFIQSSGI